VGSGACSARAKANQVQKLRLTHKQQVSARTPTPIRKGCYDPGTAMDMAILNFYYVSI
jgi:hypothetical protein